jgi:hypothetical protein
MDITSLLQEAPSRDRTRRKQQPWEDSAGSSKAVEDQLPSMSVLSTSVTNDYNPSGPSANNSGHQQPSRSFQAVSDYPLPASNNDQSQSQSQQQQQQPSSSYSYYQKRPEREKERAGLPLNPPPDYVDVDTPEGTIRMKKQDYLKQSQLAARPISVSLYSIFLFLSLFLCLPDSHASPVSCSAHHHPSLQRYNRFHYLILTLQILLYLELLRPVMVQKKPQLRPS